MSEEEQEVDENVLVRESEFEVGEGGKISSRTEGMGGVQEAWSK